jgi:hypothetical protein
MSKKPIELIEEILVICAKYKRHEITSATAITKIQKLLRGEEEEETWLSEEEV